MAGSEVQIGVGTNPYVGPRPFETGERLFGREREITELYYLLSAERIVLLHSPSGAGKSSLIQAGLIPRLRERFDVWRPTRVNLPPTAGVKQDVNRYASSAALGFEQGIPEKLRRSPGRIAGTTLSEYARGRPRRPSAPESVLLIFDQFEEILTIDPLAVDAKREFFDQLGELLHDPRYWAIFAMREDYLAPLDPYAEQVPTHLKNRFRIDLLGLEEAREAIATPSLEAGREFSATAVDKLVRDLATMKVQQPDGTFVEQTGLHVEPLQLQVVCRGLWERIPESSLIIGLEDVEQFGNVTEALSDYYAAEVAKIAAGDVAVERAIREWVGEKLITPDGIRGQVLRGAGMSEGLANNLIASLVDTHLVRAEQRAGAVWYELAHDRLIEPVRTNNAAWRDAHLNQVQKRASVWEAQSRPAGLLLLGTELDEAQRWAQEQGGLTEVERRFLSASVEAQAAAEKERRQARRIRWLAVVSTVVGVLALIAGAIAWNKSKESDDNFIAAQNEERKAKESAAQANWKSWLADGQRILADKNASEAKAERSVAEAQKARAEQQAHIADSRRLAGLAPQQLSKANDLAILVALEATRLAPTTEGQSSLESVLRSSGVDTTLYTPDSTAVAFSADNSLLASASVDLKIRLWDVKNSTLAKTLECPLLPLVSSLIFSPDGGLLAAGGTGLNVMLWDLKNGAKSKTLPVDSEVFRLAFSPRDRALLAVAGSDDKVGLWDTRTGGKVKTLEVKNTWTSMAFSPDGARLALGSIGDRKVMLWEIATGTPHQLEGHTAEVTSVGFSLDGKYLASGQLTDTGPSIILWDGRTGANLKVLADVGAVNNLAFDANNHLVAGIVRGESAWLFGIWDPEPGLYGRQLQRWEILSNYHQIDTPVGLLPQAFSPDGTRIAMWGLTAEALRDKITLLDLRSRDPLKVMGKNVRAVAFSPDGALIAAGGIGVYAGIKLWNAQTWANPKTLADATGAVLAFSPDGTRLASGSEYGRISLWNARTGSKLWTSEGTGAVNGVGFSSDGSRVFQAGADQKVIIWDARSGTRLKTLEGPRRVSTIGVAFGRDGAQVAVSDSKGLFVWDTRGGAKPEVLEDTEAAGPVIFSRDGTLLAAGIFSDVALFKPGSSHRLRTMEHGHDMLGGEEVKSVAFSRDGTRLASAGRDNKIIIWDVESGARLKIMDSQDGVNSVAFSPDGTRLLSGGEGGTFLWGDIDLPSWQLRACRAANRNLTHEEWNQLVGSSIPYRLTCPNLPAPKK